MAFSLTLTFQYVTKYLSSGNDQGMENILKFPNFPKMFGKGLGAPTTHPNLQMKISKFSKIFKFSFAGLGALWVRQALFQRFSESLKILECFPYLDRFHSTSTY